MNRDTVDQLRDQIITAFASASPSDPADLIHIPQPDDEGSRHIELELAGQPWTGLRHEFLLEWWPSFGSLLPASYRYYLQALLVQCLNDVSDANRLISGTLMVLTPSFYRLYHYGRDRRFELHTSLFTPEQTTAVCSFLDLFLTLPRWRFRSAQAIRFGWNQVEHPALKRCREFYAELHHYTYPAVADPDRRELIAAIREAFDPRPYPGDDRLCGSDYGDEPAEYALEFSGLDWRTLHPDFLAQHYAAPSFFADEGFAYFLPAFMIADVLGEAGNADPVFHLTHGLYDDPPFDLVSLNSEVLQASRLASEEIEWLQGSLQQANTIDWHAYALRRFAVFRWQERQAIIRYLEYRVAHTWDSVAKKISAALDSYWIPSLDQGQILRRS